MPLARLSTAIVSQLRGHVQKLGDGCAKPSRKFLQAMTLGITMSGSVLLSETARRLMGLQGVSFHALHKKLCRGLKSKGWAAMPVQEAYLKQAAAVLPRERLIACDLGDISKPRALKMPGLRTVRDGSTGTLKKGWWLIEIEAVFGKRGGHLPLWLELFSVGRRRYKSQRDLVERAIETVSRHIGKHGLWLFDRGFDAWEYFVFLARQGLRFLIRVQAIRVVRLPATGKKVSLGALARSLPTPGRYVLGRRRSCLGRVIQVGWAEVEILQSGQRLWLIVARGFGRHPILWLTNSPVENGTQAVTLARSYIRRWGVEEAGRLVKQAFDLEDIRVLTWPGLVKLVWLTMWTYGLLCMIRLRAKRLYRALLQSYPAFGPIPRYPYYRLAGGIAVALLFGLMNKPVLFSPWGKSG